MKKILDPRNMGNMVHIAKLSASLDKHIGKRCLYCDKDLGNNPPVIEFVNHLVNRHPDKIDARDVEGYHKLIKKVTG